MSYTPHTWQSGETVTAEKLNVLEQGVASGGGGTLLVTITEQADTPSPGYITYTMSKTWQEIHDAIVSGVPPLIYTHTDYEGEDEFFMLNMLDTCMVTVSGIYRVDYVGYYYDVDSPNGYPSYVRDPGPM